MSLDEPEILREEVATVSNVNSIWADMRKLKFMGFNAKLGKRPGRLTQVQVVYLTVPRVEAAYARKVLAGAPTQEGR